MELLKKISQSLVLTGLCTFTLIGKIHIDQEEKIEVLAEDQKILKKKKILIFTSKGGSGHMAATAALTKLLGTNYEVSSINPIEKILRAGRITKTITGKYDTEDLYNKMLNTKWINTLNFSIGYIAPIRFNLDFQKYKKKFLRYLTANRPDLIISAIPVVNGSALAAANELDIPYLMITLDTDIQNWGICLRRNLNYKKFAMTVGFKTHFIKKQIKKWHVPSDKIFETGFPIREDFLHKRTTDDLDEIYKTWNIPQQKFTTMILMGGAGSGDTIARFVKQIAKEHLDTHVIACVGRDTKAEELLTNVKKEFTDLSITIVPFTSKIADLMAVSDVIITKPGPGSIYEALHMELPMIVDYTSLPVFWEKAGIKLVEENNWGVSLKYLNDLPDTLVKLMTNKQHYSSIKNSLRNTKKKVFNTEIQEIIETLL